MQNKLDERPTALLSGATGGIGRAIAARLAPGYRLFLLGRDAQTLAALCRNLEADGGRAEYLDGDLGDAGYAARAVDAMQARYGRVDVLVNNAGYALRGAVQDADAEAWLALMDVNFGAALRLTQLVLEDMIARRSGAVINISSISGRHTGAGGGAYAASKHAMNGFTGCLFEDVREHGIKVSTIMPGFVDTRLTAELGRNAKRMIQPEDVAAAIDYVLASSPHCCPTEIVLRPQQAP